MPVDFNKTNTAAQFIQKRYNELEKEKIADKLFITIDPENNCVIVNNALKLIIRTKDNIMILEDPFIDSSVCKECMGKKEKEITCLRCEGLGQIVDENYVYSDEEHKSGYRKMTECPRCDGKGFRLETCKICKGSGQGIVLPDSAKTRPTSGRIVSRGPECSIFNLGDRVAYSGYTGHLLPFKGNNRIRVMRETEPFCQLIDLEVQDQNERVEFIDKDSAYDLS